MATPETAVKVFVAYARRDEPFRRALALHLRPLERSGDIKVWHDRLIEPGMNWEQEINRPLEECAIILLLISPDFFDSDYCWGIEMKLALARHDAGTATLIPVRIKACCTGTTPVHRLQALPSNGRPVNLWTDRDRALSNVAEELEKLVKRNHKPGLTAVNPSLPRVAAPDPASDFRRFFGLQNASNRPFRVIFFDAELPGGGERRDIKLNNRPRECDVYENPLPKGITHVVPFEEVVAILSIDGLFRKFDRPVEICLDEYRDKDLPPESGLAIGLGFNNVTVKLGKLAQELFKVTYDDRTDDFTIQGKHPRTMFEEDYEYALIARVLVSEAGVPPVPYLVCGGHTAYGTTAACNFLAANWKEIMQTYEEQGKDIARHNMAAVLIHPRFERRHRLKLLKPVFSE